MNFRNPLNVSVKLWQNRKTLLRSKLHIFKSPISKLILNWSSEKLRETFTTIWQATAYYPCFKNCFCHRTDPLTSICALFNVTKVWRMVMLAAQHSDDPSEFLWLVYLLTLKQNELLLFFNLLKYVAGNELDLSGTEL